MNLNELRDKIAKEFCIETEHRFEYAKSWEENVIIFNSGWSALLKHLEGAAGGFDSFESKDHAEGLSHIQAQGATYTFVDGASWQFSQCKARIGLAEEHRERSESACDAAEQRVVNLEAKLAESERQPNQEIPFLDAYKSHFKSLLEDRSKLATAEQRCDLARENLGLTERELARADERIKSLEAKNAYLQQNYCEAKDNQKILEARLATSNAEIKELRLNLKMVTAIDIRKMFD